MDKLMQSVIEAAIRAPSGDNCQPWWFRPDGARRLCVDILPERAKSFFDFGYRGSFLSAGTVIENIRTQAAKESFSIEVDYMGGVGINNPAAVIDFREQTTIPVSESYFEAMRMRTVNRRPYLPHKIPRRLLKSVLENPVDQVDVRVFEDRTDIERLARLVFLGERVRYSHPVIHEELFSKMLMSREEAEEKRIGLEIDRLGAGPLAKPLMQLIKPWERMRRLSRFYIDQLLARHSQLMTLLSGAVCLVSVAADTAESWIKAGEQVQRLWINAQAVKLCVHPMTVALFLNSRYCQEGMKNFLPRHEPLLQEIRSELGVLLPSRFGTMLFRLGRGIRMKNLAIRLPLERFYED